MSLRWTHDLQTTDCFQGRAKGDCHIGFPTEVISNSKLIFVCVQVLHYLLSQPALVVKSWRARIYNFSSGTLLKLASVDLLEYLEEAPAFMDDRNTALEKLHPKDKNCEDLFKILGNAVFKFIQLKPQPFPSALQSKKHFRQYQVWKRAMVGLHMARVVLRFPASKQWHKYNAGDYKWNVRFFRFWLKRDTEIVNASTMFQSLPDDATPTKGRKRKRHLMTSPSISSASEAPCTVFTVNDSTSEEEPCTSNDDIPCPKKS